MASLGKQQDVLTRAWTDGDMIQVTARVLAITAIVITAAGAIYMVLRFARKNARVAWRATAGKPVKRALAVVLGGAVLGGSRMRGGRMTTITVRSNPRNAVRSVTSSTRCGRVDAEANRSTTHRDP